MTTDETPRKPSKRRVELGPTGESVRRNVARLRKLRGHTLREVSALVADRGRPLAHTAIGDIENGSRRVDADDLVALALALNVSPSTLLMPYIESVSEWRTGTVQLTETVSADPEALWEWLIAEYPLVDPSTINERAVMSFQLDSMPPHAFLMDSLMVSRRAKRAAVEASRDKTTPAPEATYIYTGDDADGDH